MTHRTVAARILAAAQVSPPRDGDYKDDAAFLARVILARLKADPKARRVARAMGIDPECPRATLRALDALRGARR